MNPAKIELNISPQKFGQLAEDIEYSAEFGYGSEIYNAVRELLAAASDRDQELAANGMLGKDGWLRVQQRRLKHEGKD